MVLPDVNVLIFAFDETSPQHKRCLRYVEEALNSDLSFGMAESVWSGFLRITTNPRISSAKVSLEKSIAFLETLRKSPNYRVILPGIGHWQIFLGLCRETHPLANDIPDVYLAALAIESGCELISTDHGFGRFSRLKWFNPLE